MKSERKQFPVGKRIRFRFEYVALRFFEWLVPKFPRRFVVRVGHALGALAYRLSPGLRNISRQNLAVAFGDRPENDQIARRSLQNVAATVLALFWSSRLTKQNLAEFAELDETSFEIVRRAQARGKGIIFIPSHFGDWELIGQATGFYGVTLTIVQEAMRNEPLETVFARLRGVSGSRLVPNRFAATTLLKTLKRGSSIALLIDQNATRKRGGVWLDFFGLPTFSSAAAGALAQHTGAAIIGAIAIPQPNGRVKLVYGPEIPHEPVATLNQRCLQFCEQAIREHPEFWMWSYKRWTPRATPEQGRYPVYSRYMADVAPRPPVV